jgi:hypothetical protein
MRLLSRFLCTGRKVYLGIGITGLALVSLVLAQEPGAENGLKLWFRLPVDDRPGDPESSWDRQVVIRAGALPAGNGHLEPIREPLRSARRR